LRGPHLPASGHRHRHQRRHREITHPTGSSPPRRRVAIGGVGDLGMTPPPHHPGAGWIDAAAEPAPPPPARRGRTPPPPRGRRPRLWATVARSPRPATETIAPSLLYAARVGALQQLLGELDQADWTRRAAPYPWSVHELVAHLLVMERYTGSFFGLGDPPAGD